MSGLTRTCIWLCIVSRVALPRIRLAPLDLVQARAQVQVRDHQVQDRLQAVVLPQDRPTSNHPPHQPHHPHTKINHRSMKTLNRTTLPLKTSSRPILAAVAVAVAVAVVNQFQLLHPQTQSMTMSRRLRLPNPLTPHLPTVLL
jgi:hypothetical protein